MTLYLGKCEDILPSLPDNSADLVLTDPPYGVGKAEWDTEFPTFWMADAARIAPALGLMPGIWNLALPGEDRAADLSVDTRGASQQWEDARCTRSRRLDSVHGLSRRRSAGLVQPVRRLV